MNTIEIADNKYPEGSIVRLRTSPSVALVIMKYQDRVYFCTPEGEPSAYQMPYFERELLGPGQL